MLEQMCEDSWTRRRETLLLQYVWNKASVFISSFLSTLARLEEQGAAFGGSVGLFLRNHRDLRLPFRGV